MSRPDPVLLDVEALDAIGSVKWLPTTPEWTADGLPRPVEDLVMIRQVLRRAIFQPLFPNGWRQSGGCLYVSQAVERWFGLPLIGGCWHDLEAVGCVGEHIAHFWNVLPDGRILDVTADQFELGGEYGIYIAEVDVRYLAGCVCEDAA